MARGNLCGSALSEIPLGCDVAASRTVWLLFGVSPLNSTVGHSNGFGRKTVVSLRIAVRRHSTDQDFLELDLVVFERITASTPALDGDLRNMSALTGRLMDLGCGRIQHFDNCEFRMLNGFGCPATCCFLGDGRRLSDFMIE